MDTLKKFVALGVLGFLAFPAVAFASDEARFETRIEGDELEIREELATGEEFRFKTDGEEFKVEGMVDDVFDGSFVAGGFSVTVGPETEVEGDLMVGAEVEAEGMVVDGENIADEVNVEEAEVEEEEDEEEE